MPVNKDNELLYRRFAEAFNARGYDRLDEVMAADFVDHHPGLVDVNTLAEYKKNLAAVIEALDMKATIEDVVGVDDKAFTRIRLTGHHLGNFLGVAPTGNSLDWYTHELWRVEGGKFVERWAVDDLVSLLGQMGVPLPLWNNAK